MPRQEWIRKSIHVGAIIGPPLGIVLAGWAASVSVLLFILAYLVLGGIAARRGLYLPIVGALLRRASRQGESFPVEPIEFVVAFLLLLGLFHEPIAFSAAAVLAFGDGAAALVGMRFGRHSLFWNRRKTWEGLLAGIAAATIGGLGLAALGHWVHARGFESRPLVALAPAWFLVLLAAGFLAALALSRIPGLRRSHPRPVAPRWFVTAAAAGAALLFASVPFALVGVWAGPLLPSASIGWPVVIVGGVAAMLAETLVRRHDNLVVPAVFLLAWALMP